MSKKAKKAKKTRKIEKPKVSSDAIKAMLQTRFSEPGKSLIAFEVANGTGTAADRWADAVRFELWPSKGYAITGYEIKVSRSDWLNELRDPTKSAAISKFCDHWYLVSPDGVLGIDELPENWGWIRATPNGLTVKTRAPKREPAAIDRSFAASLLRKTIEKYADKKLINAAYQQASDEQKARWQRHFESEIQRLKSSVDSYKELIAKFRTETGGVNIDTWRYEGTAKAIRAVRENRTEVAEKLAKQISEAEFQLKRDRETLEALGGWPK